jgi:DNA-binding NtrC family response regulator
MRRKKKPIQKSKDYYIILAAPDDENLLATSATLREMNISFQVVDSMSDLQNALLRNSAILGAIITREFLGRNALRTLKKIKSIDPEIPIILATSETSAAFEKKMRQIGIFYYLLSPYDREEFIGMVTALHSQKAKRASVYRNTQQN